jgi:DDE superfamily endonuclease
VPARGPVQSQDCESDRCSSAVTRTARCAGSTAIPRSARYTNIKSRETSLCSPRHLYNGERRRPIWDYRSCVILTEAQKVAKWQSRAAKCSCETVGALALLWQILSALGFPNQFLCDSWVVGFGGADHGRQGNGLESGTWAVPHAFCGAAESQGAAPHVSALRFGADRSWRSQEHSADGGTACGWDYDQLHHFIAAGVWDAKPVETELLVQADKLVGGSDAVLVIDDTAIAKKGTHSEGVAPQYASALGKTANCQTLVSLTLARGEVPVMLALRLFLPESWTSNPARLQQAGVPAAAQTKPEIALAQIFSDQLVGDCA